MSESSRSARKLALRALGITAVVVVCIFGLWVLQKPFESAAGDTFEVSATVDHTSSVLEGSVTISGIKVQQANGKAADWFNAPSVTVYETYSKDKYGAIHGATGKIFTASGTAVPLNSLKPGDHIRATGAIHANNFMNMVTDRAVFERIDVTS